MGDRRWRAGFRIVTRRGCGQVWRCWCKCCGSGMSFQLARSRSTGKLEASAAAGPTADTSLSRRWSVQLSVSIIEPMHSARSIVNIMADVIEGLGVVISYTFTINCHRCGDCVCRLCKAAVQDRVARTFISPATCTWRCAAIWPWRQLPGCAVDGEQQWTIEDLRNTSADLNSYCFLK